MRWIRLGIRRGVRQPTLSYEGSCTSSGNPRDAGSVAPRVRVQSALGPSVSGKGDALRILWGRVEAPRSLGPFPSLHLATQPSPSLVSATRHPLPSYTLAMSKRRLPPSREVNQFAMRAIDSGKLTLAQCVQLGAFCNTTGQRIRRQWLSNGRELDDATSRDAARAEAEAAEEAREEAEAKTRAAAEAYRASRASSRASRSSGSCQCPCASSKKNKNKKRKRSTGTANEVRRVKSEDSDGETSDASQDSDNDDDGSSDEEDTMQWLHMTPLGVDILGDLLERPGYQYLRELSKSLIRLGFTRVEPATICWELRRHFSGSAMDCCFAHPIDPCRCKGYARSLSDGTEF